jgi:hypothetical protein
MLVYREHSGTARERRLTGSIESERPDILATILLAHISADQTLGAGNSSFAEGMKRLDERLESRQEEVVWAGEAEGFIHRIVACGLRYLAIGQVPERVRGRTQLGGVASSRVASFVVDGACDDRHVCHFSGFEEIGDTV